MGDWFMGEIRILPYRRGAPSGWQACDGSLLQIAEYDALYALIGTTYGGDGQTSFAVPDLRGRVPIHQGTGSGLSPRALGLVAGSDAVTPTVQQMGPHAHVMLASTDPATSASPASTVLAAIPTALNEQFYATAPGSAPSSSFPATMLRPAGGNQPHGNTAPTLTLQYCIATAGIYPSQ